jgi:hypothetical protein
VPRRMGSWPRGARLRGSRSGRRLCLQCARRTRRSRGQSNAEELQIDLDLASLGVNTCEVGIRLRNHSLARLRRLGVVARPAGQLVSKLSLGALNVRADFCKFHAVGGSLLRVIDECPSTFARPL